MESTATWMEERIATDGQRQPPVPPRTARSTRPTSRSTPSAAPTASSTATGSSGSTSPRATATGSSTRPGSRPAASRRTAARTASRRCRRCCKRKGGLTKIYAQFAAGNLTPAANYPEGADTPAPQVRRRQAAEQAQACEAVRPKVNHLASRVLRLRPRQGPGRQEVEARALRSPVPPKRTSPAAVVVVHQLDGKRKVKSGQAQPAGRRAHQGALRQPQASAPSR